MHLGWPGLAVSPAVGKLLYLSKPQGTHPSTGDSNSTKHCRKEGAGTQQSPSPSPGSSSEDTREGAASSSLEGDAGGSRGVVIPGDRSHVACWGARIRGPVTHTSTAPPASHIHLHASPLAPSASQESTCVHLLTCTHTSRPSPRAPRKRDLLWARRARPGKSSPAGNPGRDHAHSLPSR